MHIPIFSTVTKPIKYLVSSFSHYAATRAVATFVSHNVIAVSVASAVIVGGSIVGVVSIVNHGNSRTTPIVQGDSTTKKTDPDAPTILVKDPDTGEIKAVSQNDIAKNPSLMSNVINTPTASDYQNAGISPPINISSSNSPSSSNYLQNICSTTPTPYFYGTGAQADDQTLYCPSIDTYCHFQNNMTSSNGCRLIKPDAPAVTSWTSYKIDSALSANNTTSGWAHDQNGNVICQLSTDWLGQFGIASRPSWFPQNTLFTNGLGTSSSPLNSSPAYSLCSSRTTDASSCSVLSLTYEQAMQIEGHYDAAPGQVYTYVCKLYKAHQASFTTDYFQCSYYRVKWDPIQRSDGSWFNNYLTYQDKVTLTTISVGNNYLPDINLCKGLFSGSTTPDITNNKLWQLPTGDYVKSTNSFSKIIDGTGNRYDYNYPPPQ